MENNTVPHKKAPAAMEIHGIGISGTGAMGPLHFFQRSYPPSQSNRPSNGYAAEWSRLERALVQTHKDLEHLREQALQSAGEDAAEIFEIHQMLLEDEDFLERVQEFLHQELCAEEALTAAAHAISDVLTTLDDPYLSARAADIRDVSGQVLQILTSDTLSSRPTDPDTPYLLVADDLSPSETVRLDKSKILGFITFRGTTNSHTAILARAMGIPALIGTGEISADYEGETALLDAATGTLILCPTRTQALSFAKKQQQSNRIAQDHDRYLRSLINKPAVTGSGHKIMIYANIGDGTEVDAALANGAEGIGLLRSEFLYLSSPDYPREEILYRAYADVAQKMQGRRTVIRTLDIGADKKIPYFGLPEEENPALGFRAIRICLAREELFKTQLRAILRASASGRIALMLPMVVSVDEVRQSKRLLEECKQELLERHESFDRDLEIGIMVETPAAAVMGHELAQEVDFFSVGTNDLLQYTLAADRQSPALSRLCEENKEPVLRLIQAAADAIHAKGGWIGICGEMAADLLLTQRFADMQIDELSVSVPYLLGIRGKVTECK